MSRGLKAILLIGVLMLVFIAMMAGIVYTQFWPTREFVNDAAQRGARYGSGKDALACQTWMLEKNTTEVDPQSLFTDTAFVMGCFKAARPNPALCDGVPTVFEWFDATQYPRRQCEALDRKDVYCANAFNATMQFCQRQQSSNRRESRDSPAR